MERQEEKIRSSRRLTGLAFAVLALACQTREEAARRTGREAALVVERACATDAGDDEACRESTCRERCARFTDSAGLTETCTSRCKGQGTCDSNADCDHGLICVVIAPVLRRCGVAPDAE